MSFGPRRWSRSKGGVGANALPAGETGPWTMALGCDPFQNVPHRHRFPLSASRRRNAAPVQGGGDLPKRLRAGGLRLTDRWHDGGGVRLGTGLEAAMGDGAGVG